MSAFSMELTEAIKVNNQDYIYTPPTCMEFCRLQCCPFCPFVTYSGLDGAYVYYNDCTSFCQDWRVKKVPPGGQKSDGTPLGGTQSPGCMDNGCFFLVCPWLTCSGHIQKQQLYTIDSAGGETNQYTIRQDLFCCWPAVGIFACCGACWMQCGDCCAACSGNNYVVTTEYLYGSVDQQGLEGSIKDLPTKGKFELVERIECLPCCVTLRSPVKYNSTLDDAGVVDDLIAPAMGLLALMYRGIPVPNQCCAIPPVSKPTGISCVDGGRNIEVKRMTVVELMKYVDQASFAAGAPSEATSGTI